MLAQCDWRLLPLNDEYAVSRFGEIKRVKSDSGNRYLGRVLRQSPDSRGYPSVTIAVDGRHLTKKVANMVCEAFHGPKPSPKHQVAHNDGDKGNSDASNVRWATATENANDKRIHGTIPRGDNHHSKRMPHVVAKGEGHGMAKLTASDVLAIRASHETQTAIAKRFGLGQTTVSEIIKRKTWRHL